TLNGALRSNISKLGENIVALPAISTDDRHVLIADYNALSQASTPLWYDSVRDIATKLPLPDFYTGELSPDGKSLVYSDDHGRINTYALDGSGPPAVVYGGDPFAYMIGVAPDASTALFCAQTTHGLQFQFVSLQGSHETKPFGPISGANCVASFSPDGRWLAFESDDSGQTEIYLAPVGNANDRRQLSASGGFMPVWRGDHIYYANAKHKFLAVEVKETAAGIDLGAPRELFGGAPLAAVFVRQGRVGTGGYMTHDGKRFLIPIASTNTAPPLNLVTNWTAELKK
ncbi:MAG: hypothetical protein ACRD3E_10840, partial [Terriglobales bacterium]